MMRVIDFHCDTMGERIARSEGKAVRVIDKRKI